MALSLPVGVRFRGAGLLLQSLSQRSAATSARLPAPLVSPLAAAAAELRLPMLAACHSGRISSKDGVANVAKTSIPNASTTEPYKSDYQKLIHSLGGARDGKPVGEASASVPSVAPAVLPEIGDWSDVVIQAEAVAAWPSHVLQPQEKLAFASSFVSQAAAVLGPLAKEADCGGRLCGLYELLCEPGALISSRSDNAVKAGVVVVASEQCLGAASREVASLLLSGHAVSLAAPRGPTLAMAKQMVDGFPTSLLQAVEAGATITLPAMVYTFRSVEGSASKLWAERVPPADFGNFAVQSSHGSICHGMAAAASPFTMAKITSEKCSKPRFDLSKELEALTEYLPTASDSPSPLNAYSRGIGKVEELLDLLWAFRDPVTVDDVSNPVVSLEAAHKHFVITGYAVPEDVVKAAIAAALSPLQEKVTLHAVGLGIRGLQRDPMLSFCRLVQSGRSGLQWQVKEHNDWSGFHAWLCDKAAEEPEPPQLFSTQRHFELEVRRSCAAAGGVAWAGLFVPEPFEQLRRWTSVSEAS